MLVAAGLLPEEPTDDAPTTEQVIRADPRLTDEQRATLIAVYRSYTGAG
jgi:hypothetical protein